MGSKLLRRAFLDTVPVMTGYLVLGVGFGLLLRQSGFGLGWAFAMSLLIYAGSMQYLEVWLLSGGASLVTAALTTLMVNARHLFYGISMLDTYRGAGKKKPYLIFALTDETYSLVSGRKLPEGEGKFRYCFWVSLLDQCYWVAGSVLGSAAGMLLPIDLEGIDFALTALFVTVCVEQWLSTKDHKPALTGVGATALCLAVFGQDVFLIPSMALIAGILLWGSRTGKAVRHG